MTEAGRQTRSTTRANSTPLGSDPPQPKTVTETLEEQSKGTQLSIVISEEDQEVCKPKKMPTAKRAKKLLGPQRQVDRKTFNELKKSNNDTQKDVTPTNVIEDCYVMTDDSAYGDWLVEQGIYLQNSLPDDTTRKNDNITDYKTADNVKPNIEPKDGQKNEPNLDTKKETKEEIKDEPKVDPKIETKEEMKENKEGVMNTESDDIKSEDGKETKKKIDLGSEPLKDETGQALRQEYLGNFQAQLNTFIWSAESEQATVDRIERLRNILDIMSKGEPTDISKKEKEDTDNAVVKQEVPQPADSDIRKKQDEQTEVCGEHEKKESDVPEKKTEDQTKPKDEGATDEHTVKTDLPAKDTGNEVQKGVIQSGESDIPKIGCHKSGEDNVNKDMKQTDDLDDVNGNPKVSPGTVKETDNPIRKTENTGLDSASTMAPDTASDVVNKKVSFNIDNMEKDTSGDTLIIDETLNLTDGTDNGNVAFLDDLNYDDLLDDEDECDIPSSQMVRSNPYVKSSSQQDDGSSQDDSGTASQKNDEEEEEEEETDSVSRREDSETEDISKQWSEYKEGHVLER